MKKPIFITLTVFLLLSIGAGVYYLNTLLPIITGYAAKNMASGIFVANRTPQSLEAIDLNFSFIKFTKNTIDYDKKEVVSSFLWHKSKAIYIEGFGCTLVTELDEYTIRNRPYTIVSLPTVNADTVNWPMGDRLADTIPAGINIAKLNRAIENALKDTVGNKVTFSVAVAYKNQLVAEKYHVGFSRKNRFLSWSMAKSFTQALVGISVKKGFIDIYKPVDIPQWKKDNRASITIENLMHMNSGLEWNENYGNSSDVNRMLHQKADMANYAYSKPLFARPDSLWYYSSGSTNIVSYLIRKKINNDSDYFAFPRRELFNPIGMRSAVFETDASGTFSGSSYLYATMRDYVRFGLLYLNNGNWLGNQILPEGWADYTTQVAKGSGGLYGSFFYLNQSNEYPSAPKDMYMCKGHDGQLICIIPSLQLVIVRTGCSKENDFNFSRFLANVVAAIEKV